MGEHERRIAIIGTGGMGRETLAWARAAGLDVAGFVDDDPASTGTQVGGADVLGDVAWLLQHPELGAVIAIGAPRVRAAIGARLEEAGLALVAVVHPAASVGPRCDIADGAIVGPNVTMTADVSVGRGAIVNFNAAIGHDGDLGDYCFVGPGATLAGNVTVGARAEVGIGASVLQGTVIGTDARVGGGAMVIDDVPASATVVGVPARPR